MRKPDFIIGGADAPYLRRWWVIPRNKWFNIYLHQFLRDDDDRALHDHPWAFNISILLKGRYREVLPTGSKIRHRWLPYLRIGKAPHRVVLMGAPVWTLFITGPVVRQWGFYCPNGWRHWREFTSSQDKGIAGRGCD